MPTLADGLSRYLSATQLNSLANTVVGIIGVGGLGSNAAVMLVRSGLRQLVLIDHDRVEPSNLNRQAYLPTDIGLPKVQALASHLLTLEPGLRLDVHERQVTRANALSLLAECAVVVEAVDDAETKRMLYELFAATKELYVTASGLGGTGCCENAPMRVRRPRANVVMVGDFVTAVDDAHPPLAPRVTQAAAMQADAVLAHILS